MAVRMATSVSRFLLLCVILFVFCVFCCPSRVTFSREELLNICQSSYGTFSPVYTDPGSFSEILVGAAAALYRICRRRIRGKRAGVLVKLRQRGYCAPLPPIHLANVHSLANNLDELLLLIPKDPDFRRSILFI